jgi:hypothetical protein
MGMKPNTRREALNQLGDTLRALAANLIGIVRGGGKPLELSRDVDALTAALGAFEGTMGDQPKAFELADMLRVELDPKHSTPTSEEDMAERYAQHAIVQASLQLAAARLLRQEAGAVDAYSDLHKALVGLEETKRRIEKRRHDAGSDFVQQMEPRKSRGRSDEAAG